LLLGLPALVPAWAQLAPSPDAPPVSTAPNPAPEDQPVATLKLNVNLVDVIFTVKDRAGNLVSHLTRDDCTVSEDKAPQTLKNFVAETHQPLTLGILLDTSGSQARVLPLEQDVGSQFLERVLQPKDEAFLLSFDVDVDLLQDYTNSPRLLARAMSRAEINTAGGNGSAGTPGAGGGTLRFSRRKERDRALGDWNAVERDCALDGRPTRIASVAAATKQHCRDCECLYDIFRVRHHPTDLHRR